MSPAGSDVSSMSFLRVIVEDSQTDFDLEFSMQKEKNDMQEESCKNSSCGLLNKGKGQCLGGLNAMSFCLMLPSF